jgi:hypothetical protein
MNDYSSFKLILSYVGHLIEQYPPNKYSYDLMTTNNGPLPPHLSINTLPLNPSSLALVKRSSLMFTFPIHFVIKSQSLS